MQSCQTRLAPVRLLSVATATPPTRYTQEDVLERYAITDPKIQALFRNSHIESRNLSLPDSGPDGRPPDESNAELLEKHRRLAVELGAKVVREALSAAKLRPHDLDYLVITTSTGFLCPGLTAHIIRECQLRQNIHRVDVVGMGCNAGLNALHPVVDFCAVNPGKRGLLLCAEICSAAYTMNNSMSTAVVNSLFGDGVAALVISSEDPAVLAHLDQENYGPQILGFESHIITEAIDAMRFDLDGTKNSFFLAKDIPYVIGDNVCLPIERLLGRFDLEVEDISHWLIHSGGKKVIDAIRKNLGLSEYDVRNTLSVLREHGNLSSGSFLFSYQRLQQERVAKKGEYAVLMTMGPGSTIETCLARY